MNFLMLYNKLVYPPVGNPIMSIVVNDLDKLVIQKKARKQGQSSQA